MKVKKTKQQSRLNFFSRLEKIFIEMCSNSEKSINVSEKSKSSLRHIRNKQRGNEKRNYCQEIKNKRSESSRTSDREQTNERNDEHENDKMHEHAKDILEKITENKKKNSRNHE